MGAAQIGITDTTDAEEYVLGSLDAGKHLADEDCSVFIQTNNFLARFSRWFITPQFGEKLHAMSTQTFFIVEKLPVNEPLNKVLCKKQSRLVRIKRYQRKLANTNCGGRKEFRIETV
jgi:hypothetical protein